MCFQLSDVIQAIYCVSGESADGFGNEHINLSVHAILNHLMELYFHCSIPPLHDKRRFPVFPVRFRKAALHGGALIATVQSSGDTEQKKQLTLWLPALRAETRNQKLRQFLEDSFGPSLYAPEDLEKLEKKLC